MSVDAVDTNGFIIYDRNRDIYLDVTNFDNIFKASDKDVLKGLIVKHHNLLKEGKVDEFLIRVFLHGHFNNSSMNELCDAMREAATELERNTISASQVRGDSNIIRDGLLKAKIPERMTLNELAKALKDPEDLARFVLKQYMHPITRKVSVTHTVDPFNQRSEKRLYAEMMKYCYLCDLDITKREMVDALLKVLGELKYNEYTGSMRAPLGMFKNGQKSGRK